MRPNCLRTGCRGLRVRGRACPRPDLRPGRGQEDVQADVPARPGDAARWRGLGSGPDLADGRSQGRRAGVIRETQAHVPGHLTPACGSAVCCVGSASPPGVPVTGFCCLSNEPAPAVSGTDGAPMATGWPRRMPADALYVRTSPTVAGYSSCSTSPASRGYCSRSTQPAQPSDNRVTNPPSVCVSPPISCALGNKPRLLNR